MRTRPHPLLAELHAHTTWSDGTLSVRELVDLTGRRGFDVLCVTDHVVRGDDPWLDATGRAEQGVGADEHDAYLAEIAREAARARSRYDLLVIPGLELTYNDGDPAVAAHAVALGLHEFVSVDDGLDGAIETATQAGAAIVAAHPYSLGAAVGIRGSGSPQRANTPEGVRSRGREDTEPANDTPGSAAVGIRGSGSPQRGGRDDTEPADDTPASGSPDAPSPSRLTQRWAADAGLRALAHRFELFNRTQLYGWVADVGLPAVAAGDVHLPEHVEGWKTLLPCRKSEASVLAYLRSPRPVYLARVGASGRPATTLAA
jgi:hypothetical protein